MSLPKRLEVIAQNVLPDLRLADVGSDHALLPTELLRSGKIPSALITDINENPLNRAKKMLSEKGMKDVVFGLGSGLKPVEKVQQVVIAGMGGQTILEILQNDRKKAENYDRMILQPNDHVYELRRFLCKYFSIIKDITVYDRGKFYTVLVIKPGKTEYKEELELEYGIHSALQNDADRLKYLEYERNNLLDRSERMKDSDNEKTIKRRREFLRRLNYIKREIESFKNHSVH